MTRGGGRGVNCLQLSHLMCFFRYLCGKNNFSFFTRIGSDNYFRKSFDNFRRYVFIYWAIKGDNSAECAGWVALKRLFIGLCSIML